MSPAPPLTLEEFELISFIWPCSHTASTTFRDMHVYGADEAPGSSLYHPSAGPSAGPSVHMHPSLDPHTPIQPPQGPDQAEHREEEEEEDLVPQQQQQQQQEQRPQQQEQVLKETEVVGLGADSDLEARSEEERQPARKQTESEEHEAALQVRLMRLKDLEGAACASIPYTVIRGCVCVLTAFFTVLTGHT